MEVVVGDRAMEDDGDVEPNDVGEGNSVGNATTTDEDEIVQPNEPREGMEFDTEDAAKTFYDQYARCIGFSLKPGQRTRSENGKIVALEFVCDIKGVRKRAGRCFAMLKIELLGHVGKWIVTKFERNHTHNLVTSTTVHKIKPHRHFAGAAKTIAETPQVGGVIPSGVMYACMDGSRESVDPNRDPLAEQHGKGTGLNYNVRPFALKRSLGRDAQNMLDYFKKMQAENPGFLYAIQLDDDNCMANVFWADARSRAAYSHFGDAVTLDSRCRVNQYRVPFVLFTGVNHHGQTILFGCAVLLDDSEASFTWLLKTFLTTMNDIPPVSIITDQDKVIVAAVSQVLPGARHCISKWHVLREGHEKLAHVCHSHPSFQVELYDCINLTETIEEFEMAWDIILDKFDLREHGWLQSLYNARAQWVPAYFRDSFFGVIYSDQRYEVSFLDGFVNQQTTLPMFFRQYERALENWFEREIEADFDTLCTTPVLKTPSPMEKEAASLYTRKIFAKFQEELVETFVYTANRIDGDGAICTFRVAKFEDDHKAYIVTLNYPEMRANCTCQMFEYSGLLCRHVLTVFTVTNVLTLPSHYILKRWTINAKAGGPIDENGGELQNNESLTSRYKNLCREAMHYAEEGALAAETYSSALDSLREGAKKVAVVKKNVARVAPHSSQVSGNGHDVNKTSSSMSEATPLLWPRQDEMTRRFNLNDATDRNISRMAPVFFQGDESRNKTMGALPKLKSMTWVMESNNSVPGNKLAVITLKLQDYRKARAELEVKFQLSKPNLEPMLKSMTYISEQLSAPASKVAVINLKLQDTETISGQSEVKFQVSKDTLAAMLRSMAYIREQLSNPAEPQPKKQRK